MIENLQNKLYYLENKQAKGDKLYVSIKWELEGKKFFKRFLKERIIQNMLN